MKGDLRATTVEITGHGGDTIEAYLAVPLGGGGGGGVVVIHHMPGYDESTKEITRTFAANGYAAVCPNLYHREAPGAAPDDAAATARAQGGVPDERLVGDVAGAATALRALETSNGKVGTIGYCSGGRQSLLAACSTDVQAAVDCYGAFVLNDPPEGLGMSVTSLRDRLGNLGCPLLGLFGNEDAHPSPAEVDELEAALQANGKAYEFHRYDNAGHAFFSVNRDAYRPAAATDGWQKIFDFFGRHLAS